nr:unnamed protein product [Spirometra erinaceieuropaei]
MAQHTGNPPCYLLDRSCLIPPMASTKTTDLTTETQHSLVSPLSITAIFIITVTTSAATTTTTALTPATDQSAPDGPSPTCVIINIHAYSDMDSIQTCSHCDRTFTSRVGMVGHLRIHHCVTGHYAVISFISAASLRSYVYGLEFESFLELAETECLRGHSFKLKG